jgi:hypothetical protein
MVFKTGGVGERECISVFTFSVKLSSGCSSLLRSLDAERARSCLGDAGEL